MDGYNAFMLVATLLVLMMTTPALALFYGGMTRSKSVLNMMMMSYAAMAIVGIIWVLWGYSMVFSGEGGIDAFFNSPFANFALDGVGYDGYTFMMFQLTFAVITTALISGAIADRVKFSAWLVFVPIWATLSYFPLAHMVFGCTDDALICTQIGAQDYAGGTAVHINAGVAGLVLALVIGKRIGFGREPMRPHNLTLTMLGAALLWVGWYGFNVGSIVFSDDLDASDQFLAETGLTFANTTLATMAAIIGWLVVEKVLHGKATTLGAASGIVAGLVAITPAAGAVNILGALAIGLVSGALCAWAVGLKFKLEVRRLARRGRRPPRRRHRRHRDDRAVLRHRRRGRQHRRWRGRRPVLRRRHRLAGRPGARCPGRGGLVRRRHPADRAGHQVHHGLAHRRGGRGRGHRLRPARRVGLRSAHQPLQRQRRRVSPPRTKSDPSTRTEGAHA